MGECDNDSSSVSCLADDPEEFDWRARMQACAVHIAVLSSATLDA